MFTPTMERWAERLVEADIERLGKHGRAARTPREALTSGRHAVWGAFFAGLICSGALGAAEIVYLGPSPSWRDLALYFAVTLSLTVVEFWLLFRFGFRAVAQLIATSADELALEARCGPNAADRRELVRALCRAVLEIPEPDIQPFDLNPAKYVRRERKLLLLILYRIKIIASNFIAKQIVRRLLARFGLRGYALLVAGPITGLWNAWVMALVLREARFRIMSRLTAEHILRSLEQRPPASTPLLQALGLLIGCRITLFGVYNQSLEYLLEQLHKGSRRALEALPALDDLTLLEQRYRELSPSEQNWQREIAILLFACKRARLSQLEYQQLTKLGINAAQVKACKQRFNAFHLFFRPQARQACR